MAHITKISAGKSSSKDDSSSEARVVKTVKSGKSNATANKEKLKAEKKRLKEKAKQAKLANKKPMPKWLAIITAPFRFIAKPFIALGRYIHDSWVEIRQVRWPNRKSTWKMVGAVFIYAAIFMIFIMLLDALFTLLFNTILG